MLYYPNLIKELVDKDVRLDKLSKKCNATREYLISQIHGESAISLDRAKAIKKHIPSDLPLEELFATREET